MYVNATVELEYEIRIECILYWHVLHANTWFELLNLDVESNNNNWFRFIFFRCESELCVHFISIWFDRVVSSISIDFRGTNVKIEKFNFYGNIQQIKLLSNDKEVTNQSCRGGKNSREKLQFHWSHFDLSSTHSMFFILCVFLYNFVFCWVFSTSHRTNCLFSFKAHKTPTIQQWKTVRQQFIFPVNCYKKNFRSTSWIMAMMGVQLLYTFLRKRGKTQRTQCKQMIDLIEKRYEIFFRQSLLATAAAVLGIFTILKMNLLVRITNWNRFVVTEKNVSISRCKNTLTIDGF